MSSWSTFSIFWPQSFRNHHTDNSRNRWRFSHGNRSKLIISRGLELEVLLTPGLEVCWREVGKACDLPWGLLAVLFLRPFFGGGEMRQAWLGLFLVRSMNSTWNDKLNIWKFCCFDVSEDEYPMKSAIFDMYILYIIYTLIFVSIYTQYTRSIHICVPDVS